MYVQRTDLLQIYYYILTPILILLSGRVSKVSQLQIEIKLPLLTRPSYG